MGDKKSPSTCETEGSAWGWVLPPVSRGEGAESAWLGSLAHTHSALWAQAVCTQALSPAPSGEGKGRGRSPVTPLSAPSQFQVCYPLRASEPWLLSPLSPGALGNFHTSPSLLICKVGIKLFPASLAGRLQKEESPWNPEQCHGHRAHERSFIYIVTVVKGEAGPRWTREQCEAPSSPSG